MAYSSRQAALVMAIALDKDNKSEHIVIGEEVQVQNFLAGFENASVLYDQKRPLGIFLIEHQTQDEGDWSQYAIAPLREASQSLLGRQAKEAAAWDYLQNKENSHDPICLFTSYMIQYFYACDRKTFLDKSTLLTKSFKGELLKGRRYFQIEELINEVQDRIRVKADPLDAQATIQYCWKHQALEYVIVTHSFYPAILYYLNRLKELKYCFCQCSVCGSWFLASSGHHSLCSTKCRKLKTKQNKREHDERERKDKCCRECKNATQRMRNRLNQLHKHNAPEELLAAAEAAFKAFQKEAIARKKKIKSEGSDRQFIDWLFAQERLIDELCSEA